MPKLNIGTGHTVIEISLIFWNHPISENYSNGPGAVKNGKMSKMAIIGPDICLKVSCVQIWQKKFQKEVSQIADYRFAIATA